MRPVVVVHLDPLGSFRPDVLQTFKDVHIENRFPIGSVESLDKAVLHRAPRLYEFEFDLVSLGPVGEGDQ